MEPKGKLNDADRPARSGMLLAGWFSLSMGRCTVILNPEFIIFFILCLRQPNCTCSNRYGFLLYGPLLKAAK